MQCVADELQFTYRLKVDISLLAWPNNGRSIRQASYIGVGLDAVFDTVDFESSRPARSFRNASWYDGDTPSI